MACRLSICLFVVLSAKRLRSMSFVNQEKYICPCMNLIQFHCRVKMRPLFFFLGENSIPAGVFSGEGGGRGGSNIFLRLVFRGWVVYEPVENSLHLLVLTIKLRK